MKKALLPFLCSLILLACSPSRPRGIMSESKMTDVLVDFHLAQGMADVQGENAEVLRYKFIQAVFKKHHITEAQFDSSMVYWSGRAEDFTDIYENVVTRVQAQAERMGLELAQANNQDRFATLTNEGDTANIWLGKDFACIASNPVQCIYSFTMKADSTFKLGDSFIWRFKTQFVGRSMNNEAVALLNFYYDTDTVVCVTDLLRNNPKNELRHYPSKTLDSLKLLSISGHIYLPIIKTDPPKPLLVSEMMLIRMHKEEPVEPAPSPIVPDSTAVDTVPQKKGERLTPLQVRESQPKEKKINVVKENPNPIHPDRGIPQRIKRR